MFTEKFLGSKSTYGSKLPFETLLNLNSIPRISRVKCRFYFCVETIVDLNGTGLEGSRLCLINIVERSYAVANEGFRQMI